MASSRPPPARALRTVATTRSGCRGTARRGIAGIGGSGPFVRFERCASTLPPSRATFLLPPALAASASSASRKEGRAGSCRPNRATTRLALSQEPIRCTLSCFSFRRGFPRIFSASTMAAETGINKAANTKDEKKRDKKRDAFSSRLSVRRGRTCGAHQTQVGPAVSLSPEVRLCSHPSWSGVTRSMTNSSVKSRMPRRSATLRSDWCR